MSGREVNSCRFVRSNRFLKPSPPSKVRALSCSVPLVSAKPRSSIRSCCWTTFGTRIQRTIWLDFRGIETITYVLAGEVAHGDSLGNKGKMTAGDVQWMTAGSGILHQEMPKGDEAGRMHGFQLWANLPASLKMTDPRYQDIPSSYVDISVPPGKLRRIKIDVTRNAFAYVFAGSGTFRDASNPQAVLTESAVDPNAPAKYDAKNHSLVLFDRGDEIVVQAGPEGIRFLLVSGKPLEEPVAWYGPIVMNTQAELNQAMRELQDGSFIRHK